MSLAEDKRISTVIYQILTVAQAGGMSEVRAKEIYYEIITYYSELKDEVAEELIDELINIITMNTTKH